MTDDTDSAGETPAALKPAAPLQARPPEELRAVLISAVGDLAPGRVVRGAADEVRELVAGGKARFANSADIGLAGGRLVRLSRKLR